MLIADFPYLSILLWLPIISAGVILFLNDIYNAEKAKIIALITSALCFALTTYLYFIFDQQISNMQFVEKFMWIAGFNIQYYLGIDGLSYPLIWLTTLMSLMVIIYSWFIIKDRTAQYLAAFLTMQGLMCGVFAAMDSILFYVLWEAMLVPMLIIIGIWGGTERIYATVKFFIYTFFGSIFMFIALLYLYNKTGSFIITDMYMTKLSWLAQALIFFAFLIAFAVKVPMWPVHTWLPDAHVQAPTGGSVILAAIMLKMGGYGFLRFSLPIVPDACNYFALLMIILSLIAIIYIGFVAIVQKDIKKLIAYSSISHMGFVTLGFFVIYKIMITTGDKDTAIMAVEGGMMQMLSHGFISGALFLCVGMLYERMHTKLITDFGGVASTMPIFATLMLIFALANTGLPGTSGFVGEFFVILSTFKASMLFAILSATILIFGPSYTLWMYKRVIYGQVANSEIAGLQDVNKVEFFVLFILALLVLLFGLWPAPVINIMHTSIANIIDIALASKLL